FPRSINFPKRIESNHAEVHFDNQILELSTFTRQWEVTLDLQKCIVVWPGIIDISEGLVWTIDRYHYAIQAGVLGEDDRIELLNGILVKKMSTGEEHSACISVLDDYFVDLFGRTYRFRTENPISLPDLSEPEPDFIIADRKADRYRSGHPTVDDIHLVIEVAKESLDRDRTIKASIYANAGILEYWIVNLMDRKLELHLDRGEGGKYTTIKHFNESETFQSPFTVKTKVSDLLP
ncbi:MAG: Uma2 family endonuclease, partial [Bacteroidota bacterium]